MAKADQPRPICFRCQRPIPFGRRAIRQDGEAYHLNCPLVEPGDSPADGDGGDG